MSHLFYDRLIVIEELEEEIKKTAKSPEEKAELWGLVDEMIHHRVLGCILDKLPPKDHELFLTKFHEAPHDEGLLDFLEEKIKGIENIIRQVVESLKVELLEIIRGIEGNITGRQEEK